MLMINTTSDINKEIKVNGQKLETVTSFKYLGSVVSDEGSKPEIRNTSHGNEVLLQDTTHLIQRPHYQWGSVCQDSTHNQTTWRPPDHHKETQTEVVWTCVLHQAWLKLSCKAQCMGEEDKADRKVLGRQRQGLEFIESQRAVENREEWRKLIVKSSVVPQWSLWLRNRWRWRKDVISVAKYVICEDDILLLLVYF